jgi:hypothetical protein
MRSIQESGVAALRFSPSGLLKQMTDKKASIPVQV